MKQTFLSGATLAALVMLVALPLVFILLQAIFPHFSAGSLGDAFGGIPALLADPQLPAMLGGTLWIAAGVALVSVMIGLPLGILREQPISLLFKVVTIPKRRPRRRSQSEFRSAARTV